jgi:NAD+ diphosphatase
MPSFLRAYPPAAPTADAAICLPFQDGELVICTEGDYPSLLRGMPAGMPAFAPENAIVLGALDGVPCLAWDVALTLLPAGMGRLGLRAALGMLPEAEARLAGYASEILHWRRTSRFCPVCSHAAEAKAGDWGRRCPQCGYDRYPHISPAVLVLVQDGDRVLLAHKPGWGTMHSILAGFVEPGESLEDCVHREVWEEVGLEVDDLAYRGSQPWPFPHQLMVGFTARYLRGEIRIDPLELDMAGWFARDSLPDLPSPISLSRRIIDDWRK